MQLTLRTSYFSGEHNKEGFCVSALCQTDMCVSEMQAQCACPQVTYWTKEPLWRLKTFSLKSFGKIFMLLSLYESQILWFSKLQVNFLFYVYSQFFN